jgi:hypothetical protein
MLSESQRLLQAQQDAPLLRLPLRPGGDARYMAVHLRQLVRLLEGDSVSPCRDAVTYLTQLYDRSITPRSGLACSKGCAHCCVQTVAVTAAEAFAVAADIRERQATVAKVLAEPQRQLGEDRSAWRDCVFLEDQACSVYASRPLACHGFVSFDLKACIGFFGGDDPQPEFTPHDRRQMTYVCRMMLCAAHMLTGHSIQPGYELSSAVAAILRTPDAEARWLKGEDVLRDVTLGPEIPPQFVQEIGRMTAFVAPTL